MLRNEGDKLLKVIVCTPRHEYFCVDNLKAQNIHKVADPEKALKQHNKLKQIIKKSGCEIIDAPELTNHPNSVFTRDVALCTPKGYIKVRMGLEARRGEGEWMSGFLESLGEPCAGEITAPGTIEGGDIILVGTVAFIGISQRTNKEGITQISRILSDMKYEIRAVNITGSYLHLGSILSAIGPEQVLSCRGIFPDGFFRGFETVEISCEGTANSNVICLGNNELIANSVENMETIRVLKKKGYTVHGIDLSEFRKGGGGPTCLILPLERK
jgi:dimethylargininase